MQKAFVKKNPPWVNYPDISTPIIADELNRVETGIDTIDDRVVAFDTSKANQNDLLVTFKAVSFNSTTGVFTFTKWNDTTVTVDTDIEKIAVNFDYDDDPTSAHYQNLVLTLSDGTVKYVDLSALITQYEFSDTSTIAFTVSAGGGITANVVNGSITADKLQPNYLADVTTQANNASASATSAGNYKLDAEAWANGTRNGADVPSTDPAYHNNSKYWKDQAQQIASGSIGGLSDVDIDTPTLANKQVLTYNSTTQMWENKTPIDIGLFPHLIIISDTGSTVTATKGQTVITATETTTGHFECDVTEFGTWVIDADLSGDDAQVSVNVDTVKIYTIDDRHFHADITVEYPSGASVSCSDGVTTLYATESPYTFTVHNSGTWAVTCTLQDSTELTKTFSVTTSGQTASVDFNTDKTTLVGIQNILNNHWESELLAVGDEVDITYNTNTTWTMVVSGIDQYESHEVIFTSKNVLSKGLFYSSSTVDISYKDSTARTQMQNFYNSIVTADKELIKIMSRSCLQCKRNSTTINWVVYDDYVWLPNVYELDGTTQDSSLPKEQFQLFTTQAGRVRTYNGGAAQWWTCDGVVNSNTYAYGQAVATNGTIVKNQSGSTGVDQQNGYVPCFHLTADS